MNTKLRQIKSYVIRKGRMSDGQKRAIDTLFALYGSLQTTKTPFQNIFTQHHDLVVEIGFGMGTTLAAHAKMYPTLNFIGIEVHPPGIGALLNLIDQEQLNNLHVIQGDAVLALNEQCRDNSLSRINIFFPDPWPKKRQQKRRLIQPEFIKLLTQKLKPTGLLHLATDWEDYANHMQKVLTNEPNLKKISDDRGDRPLTKFEQKGLEKGHQVFDLQFIRI